MKPETLPDTDRRVKRFVPLEDVRAIRARPRDVALVEGPRPDPLSVGAAGCEKPLEPLERLRPAIAMELPARLRLERPLLKDDARSGACGIERDRDERLLVVRIRRLPGEGEDEPPRRLYGAERADEEEGRSVGWLHGDSERRSLNRVELEVRHSESCRPPPLLQLLAVDKRLKDTFRRRRENHIQTEFQSVLQTDGHRVTFRIAGRADSQSRDVSRSARLALRGSAFD